MNRSQAKSDLLWAINSPDLLHAQAVDSLFPCSLDEAEIDESRLIDFMNCQPSRRVGRYFERLIEFYLRYVAGFELIATQQQVCVNGQTIGEIDYLYRDHDGLLNHLEVAIKFYLYWPFSTVHGSHYLGPNTNDTLERKAKRIREHQLPLSRRINANVHVRQAMVKGAICYPYSSTFSSTAIIGKSDSVLADEHSRGLWVRGCQLEKLAAGDRPRFYLLQKPHWLAPDRQSNSYQYEEFCTLLDQHFLDSDLPIHAYMVWNSKEPVRLFIVSQSWPVALSEGSDGRERSES